MFVLKSFAIALVTLTSVAAMACSRPIQVPVSATGQSVVIEGDKLHGIYPELLRNITAKERCRFIMTPVPRARLEKMFETGMADMMVATSRSARRDEFGVFVPMVRSRPAAISLDESVRAPFTNTQELLNHKSTRLVLVRGYDYGSTYQELIDTLGKENRLVLEAEPVAVARLMRANPNDVTIMVPTILYSAMQQDARLNDQLDKLRIEPLDDLAWGESGVYLSKNALEPSLFKYLQAIMQRAAQSGVVYKGFASYYPAQVLKDSVKSLERNSP